MASSPITSWQMAGKKVEMVTDIIFLGSKITVDVDCSHEIKRCLLLGRKAMRNLDSILKIRDIILPTKVHIVKAIVFPVVMYGCERWTIKKADYWELMLLNCGVGEDSWESLGLQDQTSQSWRRSTLNIHWKDWCRISNTLDTLMWRGVSLEKNLMLGRLKAKRGWQRMRWLDSIIEWHEFDQALGDTGRQRKLVWYTSWGCKESDSM